MNLGKKRIYRLCVYLLIVSTVMMNAAPAYADHDSDAVPFAGGDGGASDPYLIENAEQLNEARYHLTAHFKLTNNIDLSHYADGEGWEPIGTKADPFAGTLDGGGHTISGFVINRPETEYVGLFGSISSDAEIQHVGIVSGSVTGYNFVGSLVGENDGGSIINSYSMVDVYGLSEHTGGLVGYSTGEIRFSHATGHVVSEGNSEILTQTAGGLAGKNDGMIRNSYATGSVEADRGIAGGLIGWNEGGTIEYSYATGTVSGSAHYTGGLIGRNLNGAITYSYATGDVSGYGFYIGGLVASNFGRASVIHSFATGDVTGYNSDIDEPAIGGLVGEHRIRYPTELRRRRCKR